MVNAGILIVSNEGNVAREMHECLIRLGYRVVGILSSNEEIIAKIDETKPDLIVTDIQLSGKREGIKTGELIHSTYNIPIVYLTGSLGQATVQRAKKTGPFGYIFKPFDEKQIYATVETALLRHHLEGELQEGKQWLNAVLDGINDGVIALDNQGAIRFINPIAKQLTGWSEIETIGKTLHDIFTLVDESSQKRLEVLGVKQPASGKNVETRLEGLLLSKYGGATPIEADVTIIKDGKGLTAGMVLVFREVTKRREFIREIQRQTQRAEVLVETAARLNVQLELKSVLDTICHISNQALKASAAAVFLQAVREDVFNLMAANTQLPALKKYNEKDFKVPGKIFESVLSRENPVTLISDIQNFPDLPYLELFTKHNIHTMGLAGLYRGNDLIGVLILIYMGDPIQLPQDTLALLKGLANQATISITNASLFEQVHSGREYQKALSARLVEIQEIERRHIARDLHDQIGQVLTGLQFMLESSKNQTGETNTNKINEAQETVSGLIEQIREMSLNLRPPMLDDIGLMPTLLWHFERYTKQTGIEVIFDPGGITQRLSPDVETAVYRIVQEALTNIARYAQCSEAFIRLNLREGILAIEIIDHGVGFDANVDISKWSTAGLVGMRERANMLGGYLVVKSAPNKGTQILVMIPLDRKPVERRSRVRNHFSG
jgi:PAS domain S-box-containing protein